MSHALLPALLAPPDPPYFRPSPAARPLRGAPDPCMDALVNQTTGALAAPPHARGAQLEGGRDVAQGAQSQLARSSDEERLARSGGGVGRPGESGRELENERGSCVGEADADFATQAGPGESAVGAVRMGSALPEGTSVGEMASLTKGERTQGAKQASEALASVTYAFPEPDVIVLDDDDGEQPAVGKVHVPQLAMGAVGNGMPQAPAVLKRPRGQMFCDDDVINVDDDEQLEHLKRIQRPRSTAAPSMMAGTSAVRIVGAATVGDGGERVHLSRGGGLFRTGGDGVVGIIDSDDEADLLAKEQLVNGEDGLMLLGKGKRVATPRTQAVGGRQHASGGDEMAVNASGGTQPNVARDMAAIEPLTHVSAQYPGVAGYASNAATGPRDYGAVPYPAVLAQHTIGSLPVMDPGNLAFAGDRVVREDKTLPWQSLNANMESNELRIAPLLHTAGMLSEQQGSMQPVPAHLEFGGQLRGQEGSHGSMAIAPSEFNSPALTTLHRYQLTPGVPSFDESTTRVEFSSLPYSSVTAERPQFHSTAMRNAYQIMNPELTPTTDYLNVGDGEVVVVEEPVGTQPLAEGMSAQEVRSLAKRNELTADATEEVETPAEMNVVLMPHQKRALAWMAKRETPVPSDDDVVVVGEECLGGILADDQGLGKTMSMIALLIKNAPTVDMSGSEEDETVDSDLSGDDMDIDADFAVKKGGRPLSWRTLIVCPLSLINQWKEEIVSRIRREHHPSVYIYHGPKRVKSTKTLKKFDIIITTYATLAGEYPKVLKDHPSYEMMKAEKLSLPKRRQGPLCSLSWNRVILDEAQYIKNRSTDSWAAVMSLKANKRWCLTGTPIQNGVDDLYSLFRFIRYDFVRNYEIWNLKWKRKLEHPVAKVREQAFKQFQTITGVVLLRRTKQDTINGKPLIDLPPRIVEVSEQGFLDKDEQAVYQAVAEKSVLTVNKFLVAGTLNANYSSVLLALLRMRQACSHPFLIQYARMQGRRGVIGTSGPQYSSPYSEEDLEEAMELVEGGHSLLDMLEEAARDKVSTILQPHLKSKQVAVPDSFDCTLCRRRTAWTFGLVLACGDMFCRNCRVYIAQRRGCPTCGQSIVHTTEVDEALIEVDQLRKEVHARRILGEAQDGAELTMVEFKSLIAEELQLQKRARLLSRSSMGGQGAKHETNLSSEVDARATAPGNLLKVKNETACGAREDGDPGKVSGWRKRKLLDAFSQDSTKVRLMVEELDKVREADASEKTLIFSQWTSMLDIIEFRLQVHGHNVCRLDGSMTLAARQKQISEFRSNPAKTVFLISLHAGGTGLNLTASSRVMLADVWWNPAVEEQAIDRVHRIGQCRSVHVRRFRMLNTVEDRIYNMCEKKREMANGTLGVVGKRNLGRTKLSIEEMMSLFSGAARDVARTAAAGTEAARAATNILSFGAAG